MTLVTFVYLGIVDAALYRQIIEFVCVLIG